MSASGENASSEGLMLSDFNSQCHQASSQDVPEVRVVNQTPSTNPMNPEFPIRYQRCSVLAIAILKIIVGSIQICVGIPGAILVPHYTSDAASPVWCGILFIVNGIFGLYTYKWPSKCMIGSFLGLSIASLILSLTMIGFLSDTLQYFSGRRYISSCGYSSYGTWGCSYHQRFSGQTQDLGIGLTSFLMFLIILELALSISAVVYTCQAYSRCCNTCKANDCCSYVGCCECDTRVISNTAYQQISHHQPASLQPVQHPSAPEAQPNSSDMQTQPNSSDMQTQPNSSDMQTQPNSSDMQTQPCSSGMQTQEQTTALQGLQNASPCPALFNIIISFPGVSRAFNVATIPNTATGEPTTTQLTFQGDNAGQPQNVPLEEQTLLDMNTQPGPAP